MRCSHTRGLLVYARAPHTRGVHWGAGAGHEGCSHREPLVDFVRLELRLVDHHPLRLQLGPHFLQKQKQKQTQKQSKQKQKQKQSKASKRRRQVAEPQQVAGENTCPSLTPARGGQGRATRAGETQAGAAGCNSPLLLRAGPAREDELHSLEVSEHGGNSAECAVQCSEHCAPCAP